MTRFDPTGLEALSFIMSLHFIDLSSVHEKGISRERFLQTKHIEKIVVLFANLFINTKFNEMYCSDLGRLLSTECEGLGSKSRPQMLLYMDSVFMSSIFAEKNQP